MADVTNPLDVARDVLRYALESYSRATVRRHYIRWREQQNPPLSERCDNPECRFHAEPLMWNGRPFKPILDHIDGNSSDNQPEMLRFLCPNCDAQLPTRGGGNKGRIEKSAGGFAKVGKDGKRHYILPAEPGRFAIGGSNVTMAKSGDAPANQNEDHRD